MKKILSIVIMLVIFSSILFLDSCTKKDEVLDVSPDSHFTYLSGVNNESLTEFEPELLVLIKEDLIKKNNVKLATQLSNTYDFKTGKLFTEALRKLNATNSGKQSRTTANLDWHMDWTSDNSSSSFNYVNHYPDASGKVLIGANGRWLSSFQIDCPSLTPTTLMWGPSCISANAYIQNNTWVGPGSINEYYQAGGKNKFEAFWFYVGSDYTCYNYYRLWLSDGTMTAWTSNGTTCGTPGSGKSILHIEFSMAKLDNCGINP